MQVLGTRGDLEIFLLLADELCARGHEIVIGTSPFYAERVNEAGLECVAVGNGDFQELKSVLRDLAHESDQRKRVDQYVRRWLRPQLEEGASPVKVQLSRADYTINNLKIVWRRGKSIMPGATITYDPPSDPKRAGSYAPQRVPHGGALLDIVAMSKALVDPANEWPDSYRFTGFWSPPGPSRFNPAARIAEFVDSGEPPIVLTMGSMLMFDAATLCAKFKAALSVVGRKGIVVGGWSNLGGEQIEDDSMMTAAEIPYGWLFPRAGAIVHHGGCGTVAAVLRAGIPSILLPRIISQENFAGILSSQGLSAATLDADTLTVGQLTEAIRRALEDGSLRGNARSWAGRLTEDGGLPEAGDLIEAHAEAHTR